MTLKNKQNPRLSTAEVAAVRAMVIHEDEHVLAFAKPAGLSSQGGRGQVHTLDELLFAFAKPNGNRPRLVHRLDRDTSGLILTAKTKPAAAFLGKALMGRRVEKSYLAIVAPGAPEPREGVIEAPLRRVEEGREAFMRVCEPDHPDAGGRPERGAGRASAAHWAHASAARAHGLGRTADRRRSALRRRARAGRRGRSPPDAARRGAALPAPGRRRDAA